VSATGHLHDPQTLYRHWEDEQWNPWSIDVTADSDQWHRALSPEDKGLVYWALSSLMVAEERITTKFAGLVIKPGRLGSHGCRRDRAEPTARG
jgi:ribonucleotide reductase beta subunit family protein with ferritin-like domain